MDFQQHLATFEEHARRRAGSGERQPAGGRLPRALIRSVQRFQAGEDGDGSSLIRAAQRAGDPVYLAAVRLFVAEEQSHAVRLATVLRHAGAAPIGGHWTDTVFVLVRRGGGLRLELLTLMLAEVVAVRYYRALRDGSGDAYVSGVAAGILADEERHVPFHTDRLRQGFAGTPAAGRFAAAAGWWVLMIGAVLVVAADHGGALRVLGLTRRRFVADVLRLFRPMVAAVFGARQLAGEDNAGRDGAAQAPGMDAGLAAEAPESDAGLTAEAPGNETGLTAEGPDSETDLTAEAPDSDAGLAVPAFPRR